jgi:hypothetical protein
MVARTELNVSNVGGERVGGGQNEIRYDKTRVGYPITRLYGSSDVYQMSIIKRDAVGERTRRSV